MGTVFPATSWLWAVVAVLLMLLAYAATRLRSIDDNRLKLEVELYRLANHDAMTGLFNKRRFEDELRTHLARVKRYGGPTTVLVIDLDRFEQVNHDLGPAVGDDLIASVGQGIRQRLRDGDVAARLGGDTFGVLLSEIDADGAATVAQDLLTTVRTAVVEVPGAGIAWNTASIGVVHDPHSSQADAQALMAAADAAMRKAKRARGDSVAFAEPAEAAERAPYPTWA